jgi:hypothetical protein
MVIVCYDYLKFMRILGIDPGLRTTGFGVVDVEAMR